MRDLFSFRVAAELESLTEIHSFLKETAAVLDLDQSVIYDVRLAVEEAVTNTIIYGYRGTEGDLEIEIELDRDEGDLYVRLRDNAAPFDPCAVSPPDLNKPLAQRSIGGVGIHLMRHAVDEMIHCVTPDGGNELTLVKRGIGKG